MTACSTQRDEKQIGAARSRPLQERPFFVRPKKTQTIRDSKVKNDFICTSRLNLPLGTPKPNILPKDSIPASNRWPKQLHQQTYQKRVRPSKQKRKKTLVKMHCRNIPIPTDLTVNSPSHQTHRKQIRREKGRQLTRRECRKLNKLTLDRLTLSKGWSLSSQWS